MTIPSLAVQVDGGPALTADNLNTFVGGGNSVVNDLRNFIGVQGQNVYICGYSTPGDGGQGTFYWNSSGTAPDDAGVTTVVPNSSAPGSGEWTRIPAAGSGNTPIANNTLLANISGSTAVPISTTLTGLIDSAIGSTQGAILYRGSTSWNILPPGTIGQVLTAEGSAANPQWGNVSGTGTVTSVATNNGLTGGTITSAGTIGLAAINSGDLLGNATNSSAAPSDTTLTALIDKALGSTQGDILYRGASTWTVLAPGTNGQFLETLGASANPQWGTPSSSSLMTPLAVGSIILAYSNNASTPNAAGSTISASGLVVVDTAANATGDSITGTWKALQTTGSVGGGNSTAVLWQRIS